MKLKLLIIPAVITFLLLCGSYIQYDPGIINFKFFELNGQKVKVTHKVNEKFYGRYSGLRNGYLLLKEDGTGEYLYDIVVSTEGCGYGIIKFEWGFLIDENNEIVSYGRNYGCSYPVIFKCNGKPCFQSCRIEYMVDYILEKNKILVVSSSDDWIKDFK